MRDIPSAGEGVMMRASWRWLALLMVTAMTGCPGSPPVVAPTPPKAVASASLTELLTKSRPELAALADEWQEKVRVQEKAHRGGQLTYTLLPDFSLPLVVPVLREARYSASLGFSVPPYLPDGGKDGELALHLARHGDVEAARKLVGPSDAALVPLIEACGCERNYPVEWTRLVGLMLHEAEVGVAIGDQDHAQDLILWHQELGKLLDAKAAKGPLGTALLARGRQVLTSAATAWQRNGRSDIADRARQAGAAWGTVPPPAALPLGVGRAEINRLLRPAKDEDRLVVAGSVLRGLDLLDVPLPADDAEAVQAFLDGSGRVIELQVLYRRGTTDHYPGPDDLAVLWEEELGTTTPTTTLPGLLRRTYEHGPQTIEVTLTGRSGAVGGLVRCWATDAPPATPTLPRDFQAASLDRSFEQNRLRINPAHRGDVVSSERPETIAGVTNPLPALKPRRVTAYRQSGQDHTSRVLLTYADEIVSLNRVMPPLWSAWGPGRVEAVDDDRGGHLALIWEDARTRCAARFPFADSEPVTFEAEDKGGDAVTRPGQVQGHDAAERQARLKAGKPLVRLPRQLDWAEVKLGVGRDEAARALGADGRNVVKRDIDDGFVFTFAAEPPKTATLVPRQLVLRFDAAGKLSEMQARYDNGPSGKGFKDLVAGFQKKGGAAAESVGPWAGLWRGLPEKKPAASLSTWQDDLTVLTCQTDAGSAEVVLRDWPADKDTPPASPPLQTLSRGPEGCQLGEGREELLRRWLIKQPETVDGALILRPASGGKYDVLLVYFDNDKVSRIVARHALPAKQAPTQPTQMATALTEAWARDLTTLGWSRRQDFGEKNVLLGMGWHDDRTQMWLSWQEAAQGPPRVYTEWKSVP